MQSNVFLECSRSYYSNQTNLCQYNWISNNGEPILQNYPSPEQLPLNQTTDNPQTKFVEFAKNEVSLQILEKSASTQNTTRGATNTKKSSYSVEELLKKDDTTETSKIHSLFYSIPPCGLLLDKNCTCNLKFISENI